MKNFPFWEQETKNILKAEMALKNVSHQNLVDKLNAIGINATKASIDSKLSRGSFSASFFLQCLVALQCKCIQLEHIINQTID